jgi:hypothetical protein
MIGKQIKGSSFLGVLNYLAKENSRLIGGNMAASTPRTLASEFNVARELNPRLKKAVYHASLSLPLTEHLDDEKWCSLSQDYLEGMGFDGSQYVVYRHTDTEHDHVHIVANRIRITDGSTVNDSWDYPRSEEQIRSLEEKYHLTPTPSSKSKLRRGQTTAEIRKLERTKEESIRLKLQSKLDKAIKPVPMPELINHLKDNGIDARVSYTRTGKVKGISYQLEGIAFSGTHLGKSYTFPGLQKYRGVTYLPSQDEAIRIQSAREPAQPPTAEEIRQRYLKLKEQVQKSPGFSNPTTAEIDIGVAMLVLAEKNDLCEVEAVLTHSDQAYQHSLSQNQLLDYINQICNMAVQLRQKTINETALAIETLLKKRGKRKPNGEISLDSRRWRLSKKDDTITITLKENSQEILLHIQGNQIILFKPERSEYKDLKQLFEQIAKDFERSQHQHEEMELG